IVNTNAFLRSAFPSYTWHESRMRVILRRRTAAARDARCLGGIRAKSQRAPKARAARCPGSPREPPTTEPKVREVAERVGFEPTCRLPDKTLSRRPRYDHFGTSPSEDFERSGPSIIPRRKGRVGRKAGPGPRPGPFPRGDAQLLGNRVR